MLFFPRRVVVVPARIDRLVRSHWEADAMRAGRLLSAAAEAGTVDTAAHAVGTAVAAFAAVGRDTPSPKVDAGAAIGDEEVGLEGGGGRVVCIE